MKKAATRGLPAAVMMVAAVCFAPAPLAEPLSAAPAAAQAPVEQVTVSIAGLYGDWKMVLPEWPGMTGPVTGDFCNFRKRDDGVSIVCADDFLQEIPEVALDGDRLRLRWGGAFTHTIYDAIWDGNGTFDGEIVQASMGLVAHRFKAKMERVTEPKAGDAPQASLTVLNAYFDDLASGSVRGKYYEDAVYRAMKKTVASHLYSLAGFTARYFGKILEEKGHGPTFLDVFKISNAENAEQWCMVRVDADGLADVRCHDIG